MANSVGLYLSAGAGPESHPPVVDGYLSRSKPAPSSFSDPLWVIVPSYSTEAPYRCDQWGALHGATLPSQGAACKVVMSAEGVPAVVWWAASNRPVFGANSIYYGGESVYKAWTPTPGITADRNGPGMVPAPLVSSSEAELARMAEEVLSAVAVRAPLGLVDPFVVIMQEAGKYLREHTTAGWSTNALKIIELVESKLPGRVFWELMNEPYYIGGTNEELAQYLQLAGYVLTKAPASAKILLAMQYFYYPAQTAFAKGEDIFAPVRGAQTLAGWVMHPYGFWGPEGLEPKGTKGWIEGVLSLPTMRGMMAWLNAPSWNSWYVTEWGVKILATGGTYPPDVKNQSEQAGAWETFLVTVYPWVQAGWLKGLLAFQAPESEGWKLQLEAREAFQSFAAANSQ